jgi:hypothetical protein
VVTAKAIIKPIAGITIRFESRAITDNFPK